MRSNPSQAGSAHKPTEWKLGRPRPCSADISQQVLCWQHADRRRPQRRVQHRNLTLKDRPTSCLSLGVIPDMRSHCWHSSSSPLFSSSTTTSGETPSTMKTPFPGRAASRPSTSSATMRQDINRTLSVVVKISSRNMGHPLQKLTRKRIPSALLPQNFSRAALTPIEQIAVQISGGH